MPDFATGHPAPVWPLPDVRKRVATYGGLAFAASRKSGLRHHAGVDILAPKGAEVVAPEAGVLVRSQRFNGPQAHALLLQTKTGPVILLGEVLPGSWSEYGLDIGSAVERGQPIARVGINPGGSTMLHYEMYREGTTRNHQWMQGAPPPSELLNPTVYLETAAAGQPVEPVPTEEHDEHEDEQGEEPGETPHDPGVETVPSDTDFDPTAEDEEVWENNPMTPRQFDIYYENGYKPVGRWSNEQVSCTQRGGYYTPGSPDGGEGTGSCAFPSGTVCDSLDHLRGDCRDGMNIPDVDISDDVVPETEGDVDVTPPDDLDPPLIPGISEEDGSVWGIPWGVGDPNTKVPYWLLILAGGALLYVMWDD